MATLPQGLRHLTVLLRPPAAFHSVRCLFSSSSPQTPAASAHTDFAVSYLVSSCGLSPTVAVKAATSSKLRFTSPEKPESVLRVLRSYGFTQAHISRLVAQLPRVLYFDADSNMKLKLEFYAQLGIGPHQLSSMSRTLTLSLQRLRSEMDSLVAALGSADIAAKALRRWPLLLYYDVERRVMPNLNAMRQFGLPESSIHMLATISPLVLTRPQDQLMKELSWLKEVGFEPTSKKLGYGLAARFSLTKSSWDEKLQIFRDLEWKDEDTLQAFKRYPSFVAISEEKLNKMVRFYQEKLGWGKDVFLVYPHLLHLSLEKRVKPRCLVWDVLCSNREVKGGLTPAVLLISEKVFLNKFVVKYAKKYPALLDLYKVEGGGIAETTDKKNAPSRLKLKKKKQDAVA